MSDDVREPGTGPRTIVLFMVDQLAAKWLEAAGSGIVDLPNLDALRRDGVVFENMFTTNPVCSPSRANLATGMGAAAHGVGECGYDLDPAVPTFMQALQAAGWHTAAFGKLHFITQVETLRPDYRPYGFDTVCNTEDSRAGEWLDWVRREHPEHYEAAQSTVWMTMVPDLERYGPDRVDLKAQILAAREKYPDSREDAYELPFPAEVSQTAWITDRACEWLAGVRGDAFAQVSYVQPHNPFAPPAGYAGRVDAAAIPDPLPAAWQENPIPYYRQPRYARATYETRDWRRDRQLYFADLAHLDHELGRVLDALRRAGRDRDAMVVFTSDHGEMLHDQGLLGKWERHYDACIRVPLAITAPGAAPGTRRELVDHTDITATIYDWARVPPPTLPVFVRDRPDRAAPALHGRTLLPLLRGPDPGPGWRRQVIIQSNDSHMDATPAGWARTIRTGRYRYTRHLGGGGEQLFDLREDPGEQRDRARDPGYSGVRDGLLARLADGTAEDAFPTSPRQLFKIDAW